MKDCRGVKEMFIDFSHKSGAIQEFFFTNIYFCVFISQNVFSAHVLFYCMMLCWCFFFADILSHFVYLARTHFYGKEIYYIRFGVLWL